MSATLGVVPITVSFEPTHVRFTAIGDLTPADFAAARAIVRAEPRFNGSLALVMDLTLANETSMKVEDMRVLAGDAHALSAARRIIIAPRPVHFGFARMFQSLAENRALTQVDIVRTLDEALALLTE